MTKHKIPTREEWRKFKDEYGVKDGASKGIELGDALDKFWSTVRALQKTAPEPAKSVAWYEHFELVWYSGLTQLEKTLAAYLAIVDFNKVAPKPPRTAAEFKRKFHDEFVGAVKEHRLELAVNRNEETKYAAALASFAMELDKLDHLIAAHGESKLPKVGKAEMEKFASGPVRVVLEYINEASHRNGWLWGAGVRDQLDDIPQAIDRMPDSPSLVELKSFMEMARKRSELAGKHWVHALTDPH